MLFMNEYDVADALTRYRDHPVLHQATVTLANLVDWTTDHSDGWAYWPKAGRAAEKLQRLIQDHARWERSQYRSPQEGAEATSEAYAKALVPIKAFRTRQGADFTIYN